MTCLISTAFLLFFTSGQDARMHNIIKYLYDEINMLVGDGHKIPARPSLIQSLS